LTIYGICIILSIKTNNFRIRNLIAMSQKEKSITISYKVIKTIAKLPEMDKQLLDMAIRASEKAYAPYSSFKVGTAILLEGGIIVTGSNQENAAYPSGLCAERVAIFSASAEYPNRVIEKIAVVSKDKNGQLRPVTPCGACRQVLYEYEIKQDQPIGMILVDENQTLMEFSDIQSLLPFGFGKDQMV
jgi:cytidine deaminase